MESFIIEGGHPLSGTITPQGAKNEALEVISATLLTSEPVTISNVPDILDVNNLIQLLKDIGVKVTSERKGVFTFQADQIDLGFLSSDEYIRKCSALRGSVLLMGPLLGRFGKASVAEPGGDKIGRRRLDTHFLGFKNLGAKFISDDERKVFTIEAKHLKGRICFLMRLRLREPPTSSWRLSSPRAPPQYIMLPANLTSSSCATCSTLWVRTSPASPPTLSPSSA